ncbi:MAG TPA: hypothetical protein VGH80_07920 [Xanthomonadaceae bacterium]|jgi:hypothetical protein
MKSNHRFPKRSWLACATAAALASAALAIAPNAGAATLISVRIAPPALPVYEQPEIPGPGYIWTPGYWAWDADANDYYWVPGTWVQPPTVGLLWTPGYWGWSERVYVFHPGYWGPHVGYYGGINYGFGYVGVGYAGGYWRGRNFYYNTAVNRFGSGVHITNVYNKTVVNVNINNHYSFNGPGGADHRPTRDEQVADRDRHTAPIEAQVEHRDAARHDKELHASANHGAPPITATSRPGDLKASGANDNASASPKGNASPRAEAKGGASGAADTGVGRRHGSASSSADDNAIKAGANASARSDDTLKERDNLQREASREQDAGAAKSNVSASMNADQNANMAASPRQDHQRIAHHPKPHPANGGNPPDANASPPRDGFQGQGQQTDSRPHPNNGNGNGNFPQGQQRPAHAPKEQRQQQPKEDRKPHDNSGGDDHHDH